MSYDLQGLNLSPSKGKSKSKLHNIYSITFQHGFPPRNEKRTQVVIGLGVEIVLKKLSDDTLVDFTQQRHER